MLIDEAFLNSLIFGQRSAIRLHVTFAAATLMCGVIVITIASFVQSVLVQEGFRTMLVIGGGFISSLAVFPLKEILSRRDKERLLVQLKIRINAIQADRDLDDETKRRDEEQFMNLLKSAIG